MEKAIIRGATCTIQTTVYTDQTKTVAANITGATIFCIVKKRPEDLDSEAIFTKSIGSGILIVNATGGRCDITFTATDMNLTLKQFYYETVVELADGVTVIRNGINEVKVYGNVRRALP
jgi:hypothetical protein